MKIDFIFIKEYLKFIAGGGFLFGATWAACAFASLWGLTGIVVLFVSVFLLAGALVANASAKRRRFDRRIKP